MSANSATVDGFNAAPTRLSDAHPEGRSPVGGTSADPDHSTGDVLAAVAARIRGLRRQLLDAESLWAGQIAGVDERNRHSALNLVHYWAIRRTDLRDLQHQLAAFGLSSLGRCEPHVHASLEAIAGTVETLSGRGVSSRAPIAGFGDGPAMLRRRAVELLGPARGNRPTRIMVTLPSRAATDPALVRELLERGMDVARINCAHDDPARWRAMIGNVRAAAAAMGSHCRVAMNLPGPKLRTGPLTDGPQVIKLRPTRDSLGRVSTPARCRLVADRESAVEADEALPALPVPAGWLAGLTLDDSIELTDTRGAHRQFVIESIDDRGVLVSARHTAYVATGTAIRTRSGKRAAIGELPATERFLTLHVGDDLLLTRDCTPVPVLDGGPARIGCTLPEAFGHVELGHAVHLDGGRISGEVVEANEDQLKVRITGAAIDGSRLRAAKGINLPDTVLPIPALTTADRAGLPFIAEHADLVELSFARSPQDVEDLLAALDELGADRLGVVLKIETVQGFEDLPAILLAAMRRRNTGVLISRGDLAGECGYERIAEVQEEILWLSEAAHLPVVRATQMLDQPARTGQPSRAEIADAAMGVHADCVMLNNGLHILEAVTALDDILERMTGHQDKKNSLPRPLRCWRAAPPAAADPAPPAAADPAAPSAGDTVLVSG